MRGERNWEKCAPSSHVPYEAFTASGRHFLRRAFLPGQNIYLQETTFFPLFLALQNKKRKKCEVQETGRKCKKYAPSDHAPYEVFIAARRSFSHLAFLALQNINPQETTFSQLFLATEISQTEKVFQTVQKIIFNTSSQDLSGFKMFGFRLVILSCAFFLLFANISGNPVSDGGKPEVVKFHNNLHKRDVTCSASGCKKVPNKIYYILWSGKQEMREIRGARNGYYFTVQGTHVQHHAKPRVEQGMQTTTQKLNSCPRHHDDQWPRKLWGYRGTLPL
ncbi:hypothetical protein Fcan01_08614 [Folsomia candida]|uniref:Uncharacterized protein n=1 Tax=Folsomia candida TaxID=158441 RepID=A0A226EET6_FOLCA|nr:hypothetical protein Fcan01_08614 [Folsomia candida]